MFAIDFSNPPPTPLLKPHHFQGTIIIFTGETPFPSLSNINYTTYDTTIQPNDRFPSHHPTVAATGAFRFVSSLAVRVRVGDGDHPEGRVRRDNQETKPCL